MPPHRLQKILAEAGVASRRRAEELISAGRVMVNGQVITQLGAKADPGQDHIKVDGQAIRPSTPRLYLMLHKPPGFITALADDRGRPTVLDLIKGVPARVYPVGRLDYHSEGLLLLTNDGELAQRLLHPRHGVVKTYEVKVSGVPTEEKLGRLRAGVWLQDGLVKPGGVRFLKVNRQSCWLKVALRQGRNRVIRRMLQQIGHPAERLRRIRIDGVELGDLKPGQYRHLDPEELRSLRAAAQDGGRVGTTPSPRRPDHAGARR